MCRLPGPAGQPSRTLLPSMSAAFQRAPEDGRRQAGRVSRSPFGTSGALTCLVVIAATTLGGVAAGLGWAAVAPRPLLVMTGPGVAGLSNVETHAFIAADAAFSIIAAAGGVVSGLLGYVLAVRRYGPPAMAAVIAGAVAAALAARWAGEQSGLGTFHHLLATLPTGARLRDSLTLGASAALAFWPLAASLVAGALVFFTRSSGGHHRVLAAGPDGPAG